MSVTEIVCDCQPQYKKPCPASVLVPDDEDVEVFLIRAGWSWRVTQWATYFFCPASTKAKAEKGASDADA